jgi:hypothetical protein
MRAKTLPVILEYCGGVRTDKLYEALAAANSGYDIMVLDNASPRNSSRYVTVRNSVNSFVGGGLRDCLDMAEQGGAEYLFFISNDIELIRVPSIEHFETLATVDESVVVVGVAITEDSVPQAQSYPWMVDRGSNLDRTVPHYDPLCCLIRLEFVRYFGGFPPSSGGWGYDLEFASYARFAERKIIVSDTALIRHEGNPRLSQESLGISFSKFDEMKDIYAATYGDYRLLLAWCMSHELPELRYLFGAEVGTAPKRKLSDQAARDTIIRMREEIKYEWF